MKGRSDSVVELDEKTKLLTLVTSGYLYNLLNSIQLYSILLFGHVRYIYCTALYCTQLQYTFLYCTLLRCIVRASCMYMALSYQTALMMTIWLRIVHRIQYLLERAFIVSGSIEFLESLLLFSSVSSFMCRLT